MLIRAGALIESTNRVHRPGHLRMEKGKIIAVGSNLEPLPGEEILSIPEITLAPGWINLHAHLELSALSGVLRKGNTFSGWLEELLPLLPTLTPEVRRSSILTSTRHAAHSGTTSILSILTQRAALAGLTSTPTRVWWALEFSDLREKPNLAEIVDQATSWISRHPNADWHLALSPHAPYTASPSLYHELSALASQNHLPFTTHLAESPEETCLLAGKETSFRDTLPKDLLRNDFGNSKSPVDWCKHNQALPKCAILAHVNELQPSDLPYLKEHRATVVHCPTSHEWFGRKSFPFELLRKNGIPVCIGTDSPASSPNFQLDLRQEIRLFRERHSNVSLQEAWEMISTAPARALECESRLGTLQTGSWADWVGWRIPTTQDPIPLILQGIDPAEISCVGGKITVHEKI
jgi:cytosine/adenosine deaminase-related metal-dependent hydrolase